MITQHSNINFNTKKGLQVLSIFFHKASKKVMQEQLYFDLDWKKKPDGSEYETIKMENTQLKENRYLT